MIAQHSSGILHIDYPSDQAMSPCDLATTNMSTPAPAGSRLFTNETDNATVIWQHESYLEQCNWAAYGILGPVIVICGVVGNLLNLVVLTRPGLKGVTYVYLFGLALSDLGALISSIPMLIRLSGTHLRIYASSVYYAHFELPLMNSFMACSIFVVVCLTVDRFISVCMPTRFKSVHTKKNARMAIVACCLLAVMVSMPLCVLKEVCLEGKINETVYHFYGYRENTLVTTNLWWRLYLWSSETIVRFGPTATLALLNTFIIKEFRRLTTKRKQFHAASEKFRQRHLRDSPHSKGALQLKKNYQEERRLVILLTSIILLFFATTTPSAFLSIFYSEELEQNLGFQIFRAAANNLELSNFALNFYIYFLCSKEFRKVFLLVFNLRRCRRELAIMQEVVALEDFSKNGGTTIKSSGKSNSSEKNDDTHPDNNKLSTHV